MLPGTFKNGKIRFILGLCVLIIIFANLQLREMVCSSLTTDRILPNTITWMLDRTVLRVMNFSRNCNKCNTRQFQYELKNDDFCDSSDVFLLIMVVSVPHNSELRRAIRSTWGRLNDSVVKTVFVVGKNDNKALNAEVLDEARENSDMIIIDLKESYKNLTLKTMAAFQWAGKYCRNAKYYLKTDDDCTNNIPKYFDYLKSNKLQADFIGGNCFTTLTERSKSSKWYVDYSEYDQKYFPVFCGGPAYVISASAARKLIRVSENTRELFLEDVWLTGFCRVAAGIGYVQLPGYYNNPEVVEDCNLYSKVFTVHRAQPRHMFRFHQAISIIKAAAAAQRIQYAISLNYIVSYVVLFFCITFICLAFSKTKVITNLYIFVR